MHLIRGEFTYNILQGWWMGAGTHSSWAKVNEFIQTISFSDELEKLKYRDAPCAMRLIET